MESRDTSGINTESILSRLEKFEEIADRMNRFMDFCRPPDEFDEMECVEQSDRSYPNYLDTVDNEVNLESYLGSEENNSINAISKDKGKGKSLKKLSTNDVSDSELFSISTLEDDDNVNTVNSLSQTGPNTDMSVQTLSSDSNRVNSSTNQTEVRNNEQNDQIAIRMARYNIKESTSPSVNSELADMVGKALTTNVEMNEDFKNFLNKYKRPDNIPNLTVPRLNMEIFKLVSKEAQQKDIALQELQKNVVRAMCPLVSAINELKDVKAETAEKLHDSVELLAYASMDINKKRRFALRPYMFEAKHLTSKDVPITSLLFGDNIESEFKKIEQANKLNLSMAGKKNEPGSSNERTESDRQNYFGIGKGKQRGGRFKPYHNRLEFIKNRAQDFLGQRSGKGSTQQKNQKFNNRKFRK